MSTLEELFRKISEGRAPEPAGPVEHIIAGLGNPGRKYEGTRHNAGYMALDALAGSLGVRVEKLRFQSLCGDASIAGKRVLLLKDSFGLSTAPYMATAAEHLSVIDLRHFRGSLQEYVKETQPDMVVVMYNPQAIAAPEGYHADLFDFR